jgi:hypothetical protein
MKLQQFYLGSMVDHPTKLPTKQKTENHETIKKYEKGEKQRYTFVI